MKNVTLIFDVGTSSIRGVVCDDIGTYLKIYQYKYDLDISNDNNIELNPKILLDYMLDICNQVGSFIKYNKLNLECISITSQRSSVICVNETGEVLLNAIMWQDKRTTEICSNMAQYKEEIFNITGLNISPVFSLPKIIWIKENENEIYQKAYKFVGFLEYLVYHLTGVFCVDTSTASRSSIFDITNKCWSEKIIEKFNISKEKLCDVITVGTSIANTVEKINILLGIKESIPVVVCGGDQQCAALGLGCLDSSDIIVNCGTGAYCMSIIDRPVFDLPSGLSCNISAIDGKWVIEGTTICAGTVLNWANNNLLHEKVSISEACEKSKLTVNNVMANINFSGTGSPSWNNYVRGAFYNLSLNITCFDMVRSVLEGVAEELAINIKAIANICMQDDINIICSGGLTKVDEFNQIQGDIYNNKVICSENDQATTTGAWISTMVYLGKYKSHREAFSIFNGKYNLKRYYPIEDNVNIYAKKRKVRKYFEESIDYKRIQELLI